MVRAGQWEVRDLTMKGWEREVRKVAMDGGLRKVRRGEVIAGAGARCGGARVSRDGEGEGGRKEAQIW